jgi:hypothetical protein
MSAMLNEARPGVRRREHPMPWALVAMAVLIALPVLWFVHLANEQPPLVCQTSSQNVVNVINSIMRDPRTYVEGVQGVAVPHGDTGGSLDSGNVYVDDIYVGVGTWFANFTDVPGGTLGQYGVLQPVNDLAKSVSANEFSFPVPNESRAASYSEHCVTAA